MSKQAVGQRQTVLHIAPTPFFADRGCHIRIRNEVEALRPYPYQLIICTYHHGGDIEGLDIRRIPAIPGYTKLDAAIRPFVSLRISCSSFLSLKPPGRSIRPCSTVISMKVP